MARGRGRRTPAPRLPLYNSVPQNIDEEEDHRFRRVYNALCKMTKRLSIACYSHKTIIFIILAFIAGISSTVGTTFFIEDLYCSKILQVAYNNEATAPSINLSKGVPKTQDDIFREQMEDLEGMGCEPKAFKRRVADLLHSTDDLFAKDFTPKEIAVKQCSYNTSHCPEGQSCRPTEDGQRDKVMLLKVESPNASSPQTSFEERVSQNIKEHIKCSCQDMECHPEPVKRSVREILDPTDDLKDKVFSPKEIEVNQCNIFSSHCPSGKTCRPITGSQKDKVIKLQVSSSDQNSETVHRTIKEDTECSCLDD